MQVDISYEGDKLVLPQLNCSCGIQHTYPDIDIYIGQDLIKNIPDYLEPRKLGSSVVVVTDNIIYEAAGAAVVAVLEQSGYQVNLCLLEREERLIPNETALGEITLTLTNDTDFLLAVGSGVITDLTRYAAHVSSRPFVVVGTAPSMDGYTSVTAPLTLGNHKVSKPAGYPQVLICDLDIMSRAPYHMLLAGFGDVMGKYISRADWLLGDMVVGEKVCPLCFDLVTQAVERCINNAAEIKQQSIKGVRALIEGLILSGLTILIFGYTRPVASIEHNMAHYWEMMKLKAGLKPPQHGLAVGAATIYCLQFFERYLQLDPGRIQIERAEQAYLDRAACVQLVLDGYGEKIGSAIVRDNDQIGISWAETERRIQILAENHEQIRRKLAFLPKADQMLAVYRNLGYPWPASALGVDDQLLLNSLVYSKDYRSRYTVFKSASELGVLAELVEQVIKDLSN